MVKTYNKLRRKIEKPKERAHALKIVAIDLHNDKWLRNKISYDFGPKRAISEHNLPVVCCLVRDGAYWLPSFLDHYRKIGVKEFFFLDNGSRDETLKILKNEPRALFIYVHIKYHNLENMDLKQSII